MISAIIIDDEIDAINVLKKLLNNFTDAGINILGTARNLNDGVDLIKKSNPDIVFLDVDMPGKNGLEIYSFFKNPKFKVIFTTAYEQYAIEAIKKSASDYLLKPINFIELREAIKKVSDTMLREQQRRELEDKINTLHSSEIEGESILFDVEDGFIMENTKNIEYCYAAQSYSTMVLFTKREIAVTKPLKELQDILPDNQFYRTHKSYLVNIYAIRKFVKGRDNYVLLKSGIKVPVSVRNSSVIAKDIKELLKS